MDNNDAATVAHQFTIEYCAPCNYLNLAMSLTEMILAGWGPMTSKLEIIPSTSGTFEVTLNGELIFSKWALGRHALEGELFSLIQDRIGEPLVGWEDHAPERVAADGAPVH